MFVALISPVVPEAAVPTPKEPNWTLDDVAILWGSDNVTAPVDADAVIWFVVPVIELTTLVKLAPDPLKPVAVNMPVLGLKANLVEDTSAPVIEPVETLVNVK